MAPLASTRVIDHRWAAHHQRTALAAMTATVRLLRVDADPDNDRDAWSASRTRAAGAAAADAAASDSTVVYDGPAMITAQTSQAASAKVAEEEITVRTYAVSLPITAPRPRAGDAGDRIIVTASPGDPGLVGRTMRVIDVAVASESFARDVIALLDLSANNPPPADTAAEPTPSMSMSWPWES